MALKKMEAIEHHIEHHISQLDVSLVKHGWFAEDAISAKTELASAGLQGTVYPITSMNCFDCPIGQTMRLTGLGPLREAHSRALPLVRLCNGC